MRRLKLHFDVSSGLKSVLGGELITDDEVAIFELVKNSFDADATKVNLHFTENRIIVADNGTGMTLDDLRNKWLFVAYSSKRNADKKSDFRDEISDRRHYAGSKGVGRFSADRLGTAIELQTRPKKERNGPVHQIKVNWDHFDADHQQHFEAIDVDYQTNDEGFSIPKELGPLIHGTVISIDAPRKVWDRASLLRLKSALAKLINPFGSQVDNFSIRIFAPSEVKQDKAEVLSAKNKGAEEPSMVSINGEVGNFIFGTLKEKTTFITVALINDGAMIESSLTDRGELIYHIREPNPYRLLGGSGFSCDLFFLNTSAKATFARRMTVPSVQFGSVFLFRNGFRVFPIGEEGNDWYEMDRRKQQGYARFLGTPMLLDESVFPELRTTLRRRPAEMPD